MSRVIKGWADEKILLNYQPEDWETVEAQQLISIDGNRIARVWRVARGECCWEFAAIGDEAPYTAGDDNHLYRCREAVERLVIRYGYRFLKPKHMALL